MISLKNTLKAITSKISDLNSAYVQTIDRGSVTLPYTCQYESATLVAYCNPNSNTSYIYLSSGGYICGNCGNSSQARFSVSIPLIKGQSVTASAKNGISDVKYKVFEHQIKFGGV